MSLINNVQGDGQLPIVTKPVLPHVPGSRAPITNPVPIDPGVEAPVNAVPIAPGVSSPINATPIEPGVSATAPKSATPLTANQTAALNRLHQATTQLEGVFLQMVMKEMSKSVPTDSLFGKQSSAEQTFSGMLDDERAKAIAQTGTLGISKVLDNQLRASVLADANHESHIDVNKEIDR
jgi:hypothetical protein